MCGDNNSFKFAYNYEEKIEIIMVVVLGNAHKYMAEVTAPYLKDGQITWYSGMDGKSKRSLKIAIAENQSAMKWYAERDIPVEVNELHQRGLRFAHDSMAIVTAFLAAYNAKKW